MAQFYVEPDSLRGTSGRMEELSRRIKSLEAEIETLARQSNIKSSSYASIQKTLSEAMQAAGTEAERVRLLANALSGISAVYEQTEKRLVDATAAEKPSFQDVLDKLRNILLDIGGMLGMDAAALFSGDPVNLSNGNYVYEKTFFNYDTPISVNFRMFYNVCGDVDGSLGKGWLHNFERRVIVTDGMFQILAEDGSFQSFYAGDDGTFTPAPGSSGGLKRDESGCIYVDEERDSYYFDSDGKMTAAANADGWRLDLKYEGNQLRTVTCTDGISLQFEYDSSDRLVRLTDQAGRCVNFQYIGAALAQVEDMAGNVTAYDYDEKGRLYKITSPTGDLSVRNVYDDRGRTVQQNFADGGVVSYRYEDAENAVVMCRQNDSEVSYYHDKRFRNIKTVYPDGEEHIEYNDNNQRVSFTDKLGRINRYTYDEEGRLCAFTNANGSVLEFFYNNSGQLTKLSLDGEPLGKAIYDELGHQSVHINANGEKCCFTYDESGRVTAVVHEDGSETFLEYDEHGNVVMVQDPVTGRVKYEYDECRRVISTTDALGNRTQYKYDAADQLVQVINAEGHCRSYGYDPRGNVIKITDFNGGVTEITYNKMNRPSSIKDPDGNVTAFEYDKMSNPVRKTAADGGVTEYEYDSENRMICIRHPMGGVETAEYDAVGNMILRRAPDGGVYRFAYDALNRPVSVTDPVNGVRRASYDKLGNVVSIYYEDGSEEHFTYDLLGNRLSHTAQNGYTRFFRYNALRQLTEIRDKESVLAEFTYGHGGKLLRERYIDGAVLDYTYDAAGNVIQMEDSIRGIWRFQYNSLGQVFRAEHVGEGVETYEYDLAGNVCAVVDGNGNRTEYQYSRAGALQKVTDACGTETGYQYDPCYRLTRILQPESGRFQTALINELNKERQKIRITSYERDLEGNVTAIIDDAGNRLTYTFDTCGRILSKLDQDGNLTRCTYRPDGTEDVLTFSDGRSIKYQFDALKRLSQIEDWLGITRLKRDTAGHITEVVDHEENHTEYMWNSRGLCTGLRYPDGRTVAYEYDKSMRISRCVSDTTDVCYEYHDNGQLRERRISGAFSMGYEYDLLGRLSSLSCWRGGQETDRISYAYDACSRKNRITERHGGAPEIDYRFSYDPLGRLTGVMQNGRSTQSYEYDIFGNRSKMVLNGETTTYGYDSVDRLQWSKSGDEERAYSYDGRGNLKRLTVNGICKLSLHFDALDRLARAVSDRGEADYTYNGMAMLSGISLVENGRPREERFAFDYTGGQNRILSISRDGMWEDYIWDRQPLFAVSTSGTTFFMNDERMSNRGVFSGGGFEEYTYDVFGCLSPNASVPAQLAYTGYRADPITGFYNAGWRQYDASAGRFISKDPVAGSQLMPISLNPFIYCLADPINNIDPTGMILAWLAGGIVGAAVNFGTKLAGDIVNSVKNGKWTGSSWESYVGTVAGGFVQGSVFVVAGPTAAGAAGAATETFITNGLSMVTGREGYRKEDGYNFGNLLMDTAVSAGVGAATGFTFGEAGKAITKYVKIPGITTGRGSYAAVWKQVMTKARRGIISNVTGKTLMKGLVSFGLVKTVDTIISKGVDAIKDEAKSKARDFWDWLTHGELSPDDEIPDGLRELLVNNRSATCATT